PPFTTPPPPLSLHDALPILTNRHRSALLTLLQLADLAVVAAAFLAAVALATPGDDDWLTILEMRVQVRNVLIVAGYLAFCHFVLDRKSTRLNSSHVSISYAV